MEFQVIYFSRKGSTKKIADAIATELKIVAEDVKKAKLKENTFTFLGSGCYGGKPGKYMTNFIEKNDFTGRKVALFGTSGGGEGKETEVMETLLKDKGALVKGRFFCKGKFWFGNKDKPSNEDLENAKKFAKKIVK
jgi:flavodoxin I